MFSSDGLAAGRFARRLNAIGRNRRRHLLRQCHKAERQQLVFLRHPLAIEPDKHRCIADEHFGLPASRQITSKTAWRRRRSAESSVVR